MHACSVLILSSSQPSKQALCSVAQAPQYRRRRCCCCTDWTGNTPHNLATNWIKGGKMTITRIYPDAKTGKFDLLGTKGNKIDTELAPMAEVSGQSQGLSNAQAGLTAYTC
jgi:hypothetical protein